MSRFVMDASVVLAWCFPDENAALAHHVADRLGNGDTAVVPAFFPHEVLNALIVGERRNRISSSLTRSFLEELARLPIELQNRKPSDVFDDLQGLCRKYLLTAYDAAYLGLAMDSKLPLATLDEALLRSSSAAGVKLLQP